MDDAAEAVDAGRLDVKKYLLFDLDGTLTDPKTGICTCVQYALSAFGIEEPDLDKLEPFIGPPLKDSFMKFYDFTEQQAEAAIEKYRERFADVGLFENELYPGIPQMLRALNAEGMVLAVASSKPTVYVRRILEHFKIERCFKAVVGSELDGRRVNKDEVVQEALRQLFGDKTVDLSQVYMVGDRCFDAEGAHKAGVESVGVTYGYGSMEELKEAKSDYIVRSVEELRAFLLRGTDDMQQKTGLQKAGQIVLPCLIFFLVKVLAFYLAQVLFLGLANLGVGGEFLVRYSASGAPEEFTGNAKALLSALSVAAGAAAVYGITARRALAATAEDMFLLHLKKEPKLNYALLAAAAAAMALGLNILAELVSASDVSDAYSAVAKQQYSVSLPVGLLCYGVVSPIAEELLFRGIIYGYLRRMIRLLPAAGVSAAIFGFYHGNMVQGIYAFIMGCLIAYAYEYFGDFRAAVGVHMEANILVYVLSCAGFAVSGAAGVTACAACLVCAVGSIFLLHRQRRVYV